MSNSVAKNTAVVAIVSILTFNTAFADDKFSDLDKAVAKQKQPHSEKVAEFHAYVNAYLDQYESWRDQYTKDLDIQRAQLIESWGEGEVSDKTKKVEYSQDGQTKTVIDYESNTMSVSLLIDENYNSDDIQKLTEKAPSSIDGQILDLKNVKAEEEKDLYSSSKEKIESQFIITQTQQQMNELDIQAELLINSNTGIPNSYIYERAYKKKMALILQSKERINAQSKIYKAMREKHGIPEEKITINEESTTIANVTTKKKSVKPSVTTDLSQIKEQQQIQKENVITSNTTDKSKELNLENIKPIAKPITTVETAKVPVSIPEKKPATIVNVPKETTKKIVNYKVKLPENSLKKRASQYKELAEKESKNWEIDAALVMAIMHSESAFRPDAKSHVPAFGLMQVVPSSAGHDVNKQMRNIDAPMNSADLYKPIINVETGTAYLHILNNRYLKSIKNSESRLYCVIAAYNTGAGNVAKAFNGNKSTNIKRASTVINEMSPNEVYEHLIKNLPYDETKNYLKKVNSRIDLYR
ncbi:transglycosylase SLT domain-containing protein [Aliivibrio sp. 1S128]|uniref:transglycosylase SLT domain-containing protein n=1 Tax=Aliivibrio sp. 1S128 TaxID=1840085 RepID=UPI00080DB59C|nr:transglycosylase SLT domain-containing protein [Aliivibrio sp. 1S128]OCH25158.1 murein transglycosylase [Aliivibrio sp. 1S128]